MIRVMRHRPPTLVGRVCLKKVGVVVQLARTVRLSGGQVAGPVLVASGGADGNLNAGS